MVLGRIKSLRIIFNVNIDKEKLIRDEFRYVLGDSGNNNISIELFTQIIWIIKIFFFVYIGEKNLCQYTSFPSEYNRVNPSLSISLI